MEQRTHRLTPLEIKLYHGTCKEPRCAICNQKGIDAIAHQLHKRGLEVVSFSEDCRSSFGYIEVKAQASDCSRIIRANSAAPLDSN